MKPLIRPFLIIVLFLTVCIGIGHFFPKTPKKQYTQIPAPTSFVVDSLPPSPQPTTPRLHKFAVAIFYKSHDLSMEYLLLDVISANSKAEAEGLALAQEKQRHNNVKIIMYFSTQVSE
jgi:hypothetical protein